MRRATYHHPKGERDESTATQKIEEEKHHHPNGGGDKAAPPTQGRKNSTSPKGDGATFRFVLLSPSLLLCGGVFSSPSSGWRCFHHPPLSLSLFWRDVASSPLVLFLGGGALFPSLHCVVVCPNILPWRGALRAAWLDYVFGFGIDFANLTWRRRSEAPPPKGGGEERSTSPKGPGTTPRTLGNSDNSQQLTLLSSSTFWVLLSFSSLWRSGAVLLSFGSVLPSFLSTLGYGASPSATANLIMLFAQMESSHHTRRKERENTASQTEAEGKAAPHQGGRRNAAPARRWVALSLPSCVCGGVFCLSLLLGGGAFSPLPLTCCNTCCLIGSSQWVETKEFRWTSETFEKRSANFSVQFFFASIAARFLYWLFFEPSRGGTPWRPRFFDFSIFFFFCFKKKQMFFFWIFGASKKNRKKEKKRKHWQKHRKMKRNASQRYERDGRSRHQPTNQPTKVFEFIKFSCATLKVAINKVFPKGGGNTPLQWRREESTTTKRRREGPTQRRREAAAPHQIKPAQIIPPHRTTTPHTPHTNSYLWSHILSSSHLNSQIFTLTAIIFILFSHFQE